jgi:hypothetical protein
MTYSLPAELTVEADGPVRTVTLALSGAMQAGFAAEAVTMRSAEHRDRLLAVKEKARQR